MQVGTNKKVIGFIIVIIIVLIFSSCNKNNRFNPDVSQVNVHISILRFDQDFMEMDETKSADIQKMEVKYGSFFDSYNQWIMGFGIPKDSDYVEEVEKFKTDTVYSKVYQEVRKKYTDLTPEENELTLAFKRYHLFFAQDTLPQIYTHVSGFNNPIVCYNNTLSVSLDNYLGANNHWYSLAGVYRYQLIRKNRNRIVPDCILGFLMTRFPAQPGKDRLLDQMIYEGKLAFVMKVLLREVSDEVLYAYTPEQMRWCKENSEGMWIFLTEHKHLFSSDRLLCSKYMNEAPTTAEFPSDSPSRAVVWLGAQIVEQFMNNNPSVSIEALMKINDAQTLLKKSKFKP